MQGLAFLKPKSASSTTTSNNSQHSQNSQGDGTNNTATDLKANSKMELPLWLAAPLTSRGYVKVQPPRFMNAFARRQMDADAQGKNLQAESPYFFDMVNTVATCMDYTNTQLQNEQAEDPDSSSQQEKDANKLQQLDVGKFRDDLTAAFVKRYAMILSKCYGHLQKADYSSFVQKLTLFERELYDAGRKGVERYETWKGLVGSYKMTSTAMGHEKDSTNDNENDDAPVERASKRRAI